MTSDSEMLQFNVFRDDLEGLKGMLWNIKVRNTICMWFFFQGACIVCGLLREEKREPSRAHLLQMIAIENKSYVISNWMEDK